MGTSDCGQFVRRASDNPTCSWHLECVCVCERERETEPLPVESDAISRKMVSELN